MPVTFAVLHFSPRHRWWAFGQMGLAGSVLRQVPGLLFFRWMGTGQGKVFSLRPDFSRYAFLAVWSDHTVAGDFFTTSSFWKNIADRCSKTDVFRLRTTRSHGSWDGMQPFAPEASEEEEGPLAVLTRATVRLSALPAFWKNAGLAADSLAAADGLVYSVGMGELPWIRQATFSIWTSQEAMKNYAYGLSEHRQVIRRKEAGKWYSEELFARFQLGP
jgi:hypothetical protein